MRSSDYYEGPFKVEVPMKRLFAAFVLAATLASAGAAHAFPSWMQEGKAGRWMFNLKIGPAITAKTAYDGQFKIVPFAMVLDFGVAVDSKKLAYILFSLQFHLHDQGNAVIVPFGFQYDIPIKQVPGLYAYPRAMLGYAALIPNTGPTVNSAFLEFAGGAKFIFAKRWNVGFEPIGFTVFIYDGSQLIPGDGTRTALAYRLLWYGGVNF